MVSRIDGYKLIHQGAIALAEVEANGMRIDVPYLDRALDDTYRRIKHIEEKLRGCEEYKLQRHRYGQKTNLTSRDQLGAVLFDDMGHKPLNETAGGKPQLDETMLEKIGSKYARGFLRLEKLNKLYGTYLTGIRREVVDGYVHCFYGLHLVRSYRGQSDSPNLQNVPIRDPIQGKIIRKAFIPRPGHAIIEMDYSGAEVRVSCCLSGDAKLTFDVLEGDMHRDMAAECYKLPKDDVSKATRQGAKGGFVFAEFYGDWYKQVTKNLWDGIERYKLTTKADELCLYEHLKRRGIHTRGECDSKRDPVPGTFEHHIRAVEDRFWNERYKVYNQWRKDRVDEYKRQGYMDMATGFRCYGPMSKNQVMNYHIQGPAFHCLLWSLTRLVGEIKRRKMGTKIIGQIHDSILADVPIPEIQDYLYLANDIATNQLSKEWDWVTVPMEAEAEMSESSWYDKKEIIIPK